MKIKNNGRVPVEFRLASNPTTFVLKPGEETKELEVTAKDIAVIRDLRCFGITGIKEEKREQEGEVQQNPEGQNEEQGINEDSISPENVNPAEGNNTEQNPEGQNEEIEVSDDEVKELATKNQATLVEMAKELGIELPDSLPSKKEIAKLIIKAQKDNAGK